MNIMYIFHADTDQRSVEGQVTTPADLLRKEIDNLKDQLNSQTKVIVQIASELELQCNTCMLFMK